MRKKNKGVTPPDLRVSIATVIEAVRYLLAERDRHGIMGYNRDSRYRLMEIYPTEKMTTFPKDGIGAIGCPQATHTHTHTHTHTPP